MPINLCGMSQLPWNVKQWNSCFHSDNKLWRRQNHPTQNPACPCKGHISAVHSHGTTSVQGLESCTVTILPRCACSESHCCQAQLLQNWAVMTLMVAFESLPFLSLALCLSVCLSVYVSVCLTDLTGWHSVLYLGMRLVTPKYWLHFPCKLIIHGCNILTSLHSQGRVARLPLCTESYNYNTVVSTAGKKQKGPTIKS